MTEAFAPDDQFTEAALALLKKRIPSLDKWPAGAAATLAADIADQWRQRAFEAEQAQIEAVRLRNQLENIDTGEQAAAREAWRTYYASALAGMLAAPTPTRDTDRYDIQRAAASHADLALEAEGKRWTR